MTFDRSEFEEQKASFLELQRGDDDLRRKGLDFLVHADTHNYAYQWTWCDLPILQMPQDVLATQEILFRCQPTVVIETGVAWGGGIALYGSIMDLYGGRLVIGVDLNLAESVERAISEIGFQTPIQLIKGSSTDQDVLARICAMLTPEDRVMVLLDSNHSHEHVLNELRSLGPLVSPGQYCIVSDTIVEFIPEQTHRPRPWGKGNNPMTAVQAYLAESDEFEIDARVDAILGMSFNPGGYLVRKE